MRDDGKAALAMHGAPRGRGAASYVGGRFEKRVARSEDDGWGSAWDPTDAAGELAPPPPPDTRVTAERARSHVRRNQPPDLGFSQSVNHYRGCEHRSDERRLGTAWLSRCRSRW